VLHFFIIFIDGLSIIRVEKVDIFGYDPVGWIMEDLVLEATEMMRLELIASSSKRSHDKRLY
jgi:hypothetical protein